MDLAPGSQVETSRRSAFKRCESDTQKASANKGAVVTWMSNAVRIPAEQVATMGDQPNDVLMFAKSGLSIAVANASLEVQREATHVTTSNEEEGFTNAVERFILPAVGTRGLTRR